jgi:hypothetical protein
MTLPRRSGYAKGRKGFVNPLAGRGMPRPVGCSPRRSGFVNPTETFAECQALAINEDFNSRRSGYAKPGRVGKMPSLPRWSGFVNPTETFAEPGRVGKMPSPSAWCWHETHTAFCPPSTGHVEMVGNAALLPTQRRKKNQRRKSGVGWVE